MPPTAVQPDYPAFTPARASALLCAAGWLFHADTPSLRRVSAALGVIALLTWAQIFLGSHELSHLGQWDASGCKLSVVASTLGAGTPSTPYLLLPPLPSVPVHRSEPACSLPGTVLPQLARAPPAVA